MNTGVHLKVEDKAFLIQYRRVPIHHLFDTIHKEIIMRWLCVVPESQVVISLLISDYLAGA
jgi:hypothetical protein